MKRILLAVSALAIAGNHRHWRDYAYANDCRLIRERIVTPSGNVIVRSRRVC